MKTFLITILSLLLAFDMLGQKISLAQLDSLLQGTWKLDSVNPYMPAIIKINLIKGDIDTVQLTLGKTADKFKITNKDLMAWCKNKGEITGYSLCEVVYATYSGDQVIELVPLICSIREISKKHLKVYCNYNSLPCKPISYSKANDLTVQEEQK